MAKNIRMEKFSIQPENVYPNMVRIFPKNSSISELISDTNELGVIGLRRSEDMINKSRVIWKWKKQKFRLTIELVPSTVWFSSIYQIYKISKWRKIKKELFEKEGRKCWVCGAENTRLEAHEFWEYDDKNHIQKLVAIHHLCSMCHKIKHIGFWYYTEDGRRRLEMAELRREDLINHFCKVNNCTREAFELHEKEAFKIWKKRSKYKWRQDFGKYDPNM